MKAKYWIAQHIQDLFRNEPKNVGVFVQLEGMMEAKFLGESDDQDIDGRKLKGFNYPDVYRQWVQYWRKMIEKEKYTEILNANGEHYRVIDGGEVTDINEDQPLEVTNYLYSLLVSEGGFFEATNDQSDELQTLSIALENELTNEFKKYNLFDNKIKHPIKKNVPIQGASIIHKPSFVQENGSLYIIESVDFTSAAKPRSRDHAAYSAYMFRDIRDKKANVEAFSIVKIREEDKHIEEVKYGLTILKNESNIINWLDDAERETFVANRKDIAYQS